MRVLIVTQMYPLRDNAQAGSFIAEQASELQKRGLDVTVVAMLPWVPPLFDLNPRWAAYRRQPAFERTDGVDVHWLRVLAFPRLVAYPFWGWFQYLGTKLFWRRFMAWHSFDLIHAHVAYPTGLLAGLLGRAYGLPVVTTIHGQDLQQSVYRGPLTRAMIASALALARRIVVVSTKLYRELQKWNLVSDLSRVRVVSNGVTMPAKGAQPAPTGSVPLILSVGNLVKPKGHAYLIEALDRLRHMGLHPACWIVGDGPEREQLEALVTKLGLSDRVRFWGRLPRERVLELYPICDVFALPSYEESFGIVYAEAMACGRPVVACEGEGEPQLLRHLETALLVRPRSGDSLAEALALLLGDSDLRERLGQSASELISREYTLDRQINCLMDLYQEVTASSTESGSSE